MNWLNAFWLINYNKRFISCLFSALVIVRKYVLVHSGEDEFAEVFSPFCWSGDHEYKLPSPSGGRLTRPGWPPGISQVDRACPGETRARPSGCVYAWLQRRSESHINARSWLITGLESKIPALEISCGNPQISGPSCEDLVRKASGRRFALYSPYGQHTAR